MPMLGVMRLILERDDGSASGDDDFFSVARTMPFVAWVRQYDRRAAAKGAHGEGGQAHL